MNKKFIRDIIETLIFITDKPLSVSKIVELIDIPEVNEELVKELIKELQMDYLSRSAIEIREVAEGYQMATKPEFSEYVRRLYRDRTLLRLSPAAIETLAIIAYKQPITKAEIEEIRGVDSTTVLETLLERRLIKPPIEQFIEQNIQEQTTNLESSETEASTTTESITENISEQTNESANQK